MGYDITKLTTQITSLKSIADNLATQITTNKIYIEDIGVNGHYNLAEEIQLSLDRAQDAIEHAKNTLQYKLGFNNGPTGPFPTGIYM